MKEALLKKRWGIPTALLLILVFVGLASALIYWTGTQTLSQTVKEVASGTVKTSTISLPNINEAENATYDENTPTTFDKALTIHVSKLTEGTRTLYVKFRNASEVGTSYDNYEFNVIVDSIPAPSSLSIGQKVLTVDLNNVDDSVNLDNVGKWEFDYKVSVTAKHVTADTDKNAEFEFRVI